MSSGSLFPEYYVLLGVPHSATTEEIRTAYKRESLKYVSGAPLILNPNHRFCFYSINRQEKVLICFVA